MQKNHKETNNPIITGFMPWMLDPTGNPHKMCPVRSYENYIHSLCERCEYLWQTPNDNAYKKGEPNWYKNMRVGENTLGNFMQNICTLVGISNKYSNHCIRVSGTTNLTRSNFSVHQIMAITGHKSINSLAMYQHVKEDEKMMMGMSLAYSLFHPQEVQDQLETFEVKELSQPNACLAIESPPPPVQNEPLGKKFKENPTSENTIVPYTPPATEQNMEHFDILNFINDVNDEEILLAATQMEKHYEGNIHKNYQYSCEKVTKEE